MELAAYNGPVAMLLDLIIQIPHPDDIMHRYGEGWAVAYFFGMILLISAILIIVGHFIAKARHRKRREVRQAWGAKWGLGLLDTEDYDQSRKGNAHTDLAAWIVKEYPYSPLISKSTSYRGAMHVLEGTLQGRPTRVFEFKYISGTGRHTVEHHFSVVAMQLNSVKGHLSLQKHFWLDRLGNDDIQTGRPVLDKRYYVRADEWGLLANELPEDLGQVLEAGRIFELVVAVDKMVVIAHDRLKNDAYDRLMEDAMKLADWLDAKR